MVKTKSTLSVADVVHVLDVLQQVQNLNHDVTPEEIGRLRANAYAAATALRIHSGIGNVFVPVREEA